MRFTILLFALLSTPSSAWACPAPKPGEYDEPSRNEALGVIATVVSYDHQITRESICEKATYSIEKLLFGDLDGLLVSEVCYVNSQEYQDDSGIADQIVEMSEYNFAVGNYPGALVAALFTRQKKPGSLVPTILSQSEYRPAITSCWFSHQVNIGAMPEEMRRKRLAEFKVGIEEVFSKGEPRDEKQNGADAIE